MSCSASYATELLLFTVLKLRNMSNYENAYLFVNYSSRALTLVKLNRLRVEQSNLNLYIFRNCRIVYRLLQLYFYINRFELLANRRVRFEVSTPNARFKARPNALFAGMLYSSSYCWLTCQRQPFSLSLLWLHQHMKKSRTT